MELRISELRSCQKENGYLKEEMEVQKQKMGEMEELLRKKDRKIRSIKKRKDKYIVKLKLERDTLRDVHSQLIQIIQNLSLEKEEYINNEIKETPSSCKALLLTEIKKNNMLSFENIKLQQQTEYLKSLLSLSGNSKSENKISHN